MSTQPNANILWFLPTHGDGRYLGTTTGGREVNFSYLHQIAQAADQLGYYGVLLPTGRSCEDSWVVASALAPLTERLRFLVAVRPGLQSPTLAARMTATLDRLSERPAADQRRHRRRSGREQGRRHLPRPRRTLRRDARVPRRLQPLLAGEDRQHRRQAHPHRGRRSCCSRRCSSRVRRSISAARPTPASRSRPRRSTST